MSSDDFIAIVKEKGKYNGYRCCASLNYERVKDYTSNKQIFSSDSIEEAIIKAQEYGAEYGYQFVNLQPVKRTATGGS